MKKRILIVIFTILVLLVMSYKAIGQPYERRYLFPIKHTNIERIDILRIDSNDNIEIIDKENIKSISSYFKKLNSKNIYDLNSNIDNAEPLYHINVTNIGRHANTTITVFQHSITYNGKQVEIASEEFTTLNKLIEHIRK